MITANDSFLSKKTFKTSAWLLAILLVAAPAVYWLIKANRGLAVAPDLAFTTITGKPLALKTLLGHPVLVTFWATDCPGCIAEIPHLTSLYQQYHCAGFETIAITMAYDPPNHVVEMAKAKQIPYPIVLDLNGEYSQAFGQIMVTPNTFLIAPDGHIESHQIGTFNLQDIQQKIATYTKDKTCSG